MALKGNLCDFSITQLLNLIHLARKTGVMIFEGPGETMRVYFREGKLAYAQAGHQDNGLAAILYSEKKLNAAQYRLIKAHAGEMGDKEIGLLLINGNYIPQQEILACLQAHYVSILTRVVDWESGLFRFENDATPPEDRITLRINLENIILEASRRLKEWEHLQDEIPNLNIALKFADHPGTNIRHINLSMEEWRVINYIHPRNTVRQIARVNRLTEMEIRRIIYSLLEAGLIEMVRTVGAETPARGNGRLPASTSAASREDQKSLIQRIISRIRSL